MLVTLSLSQCGRYLLAHSRQTDIYSSISTHTPRSLSHLPRLDYMDIPLFFCGRCRFRIRCRCSNICILDQYLCSRVCFMVYLRAGWLLLVTWHVLSQRRQRRTEASMGRNTRSFIDNNSGCIYMRCRDICQYKGEYKLYNCLFVTRHCGLGADTRIFWYSWLLMHIEMD